MKMLHLTELKKINDKGLKVRLATEGRSYMNWPRVKAAKVFTYLKLHGVYKKYLSEIWVLL